MKPTTGPNSDPNKSLSIGKAAHITAASEGGPRYDRNLTSAQRKHISNGIWLCSSCADIIDLDEDTYPTTLLKDWVASAERHAKRRLNSGTQDNVKTQGLRPIVEVRAIGLPDGAMKKGSGPYKFSWRYELEIINQSQEPLINVKICPNPSNEIKSTTLAHYSINNLPSLHSMKVKIESELTMMNNPNLFANRGISEDLYNDVRFLVEYQSMSREYFFTEIVFEKGKVSHLHLLAPPDTYHC